ncbi:MAG: helix-turn-helix domain-containing protein [Pseudonocardiales bacterium]|nr:helix-turn-helix domain-containing protein [Pseudonocardiales bacterium]
MTTDRMLDEDLRRRVRKLRAAGRSPKKIARALGVRPATIAPLVRTLAQQDAATQQEPAVVGCWVSPGWSTALTINNHEDWPDVAIPHGGPEGVACVVVARRYRAQQVSVCGYLVDVYCLGVKNALGPRIMNERDLPAFLRRFFTPFNKVSPPLAAPLELARHLVWGAVDYARRLGFEPAPDFARAAGHLGLWQQISAITFGRHGVPFYVSGPFDNPARVICTLTSSVGEGNFHFIAPVATAASCLSTTGHSPACAITCRSRRLRDSRVCLRG